MRAVALAREWFRSLTPILEMRTNALRELRVAWSTEDGVAYFRSDGIPYGSERAFRVMGPRPPVPVFREALALNLANLTVPVHTVQPNEYALPDGRPLFFAGRCPVTRTVYVTNIDPPIDYVRSGPELGWILSLWERCGRFTPECVALGMRAISLEVP